MSKKQTKPRLKLDDDALPTILKGGQEVPLNAEQKEKLKYTIKAYGKSSIEAKALMLQYASETRVEPPKLSKLTSKPDVAITKAITAAITTGKSMMSRLRPADGKLRLRQKPQKPVRKPKVNPKPIQKTVREKKPKANVNDVVKTVIDLIILSRKREAVIDRKFKAVEKRNYEKAAALRIREQGYDGQIDKTITDLRRLKRFL